MIVISGASGFVGRRLAVRLKTEWPAAELKCLVKLDDDNFCANGNELLLSHEIRPVCADLITGHGLDRLQGPEILFHLAANTHTWEKDQRCNDVGTENLLRAVEPLGARNHVIFT